MKPEIKEMLTQAFQKAYDNAENEVEKRKLFWLARDLGIKIYRKEDDFVYNIKYGNKQP